MRAAVADLGLPVRAVDVGCGTGISTRLLAQAGAEVIGLDPNRDMLEQARREPADPDLSITYREGSAEQTGLPDRAVKLVVCAQAFHWFDISVALAEFHRVLEPAGRLALLWNVRKPSDPFMEGYEAVVRRAQRHAESQGQVVRRHRSHRPDGTGHFANVRVLTYSNPQPLDLSGLLGRARSASYFPRSGALRAELDDTLRDLFAEHQVNGRITLRHETQLTLADPVARA
jgi:SAM-dependent methyltransferase